MKTGKTLEIPQSVHGDRLDHALALLLPESSLRERRRLWDEWAVLVDGKPRSKGFRVQAGQTIAVIRQTRLNRSVFTAEKWPEVRIVARQGDFAALFKPAGLHTALVPSSRDPSLEQGLAAFFAEPGVRLLNRLDQLTSGLVLAACGSEAEKTYHRLQDSGQVLKYYLAVCRGRAEKAMSIRQRIHSAGTRKVRIAREQDPDPLRRTRIKPLAYDAQEDLSLVQALIFKGVRHQIRAHLAWLGHPLAGDPLYDTLRDRSARLFHYHIEFPGFACALEPETHFLEKDDSWTFR